LRFRVDSRRRCPVFSPSALDHRNGFAESRGSDWKVKLSN
jgi:hypothetical protein